MLTIDTDEIVIGYPSMFELMWDLKGVVHQILQRQLHSEALKNFSLLCM